MREELRPARVSSRVTHHSSLHQFITPHVLHAEGVNTITM
jgi:hypothetical protein